jgi:ferric iron reductase protein FhuF
MSRLHAVEGSRAHLVAAVDLYEDEEPELLLCYNRKSAVYSASSSWYINLITADLTLPQWFTVDVNPADAGYIYCLC